MNLSIHTLVTDWDLYKNSFLASFIQSHDLKNRSFKFELNAIENKTKPRSAASALNEAIEKSRYEIVILVHQDVVFQWGWMDQVLRDIKKIESKDEKWGILGLAGKTMGGTHYGSLLNPDHTIYAKRRLPHLVQTVDEVCLILNKKRGIRFDEKTFKGFHFYGADLCLNSRDQHFKNYAIEAPLQHLSNGSYDAFYRKELAIFQAKWRKLPIIQTTTMAKFFNLVGHSHSGNPFRTIKFVNSIIYSLLTNTLSFGLPLIIFILTNSPLYSLLAAFLLISIMAPLVQAYKGEKPTVVREFFANILFQAIVLISIGLIIYSAGFFTFILSFGLYELTRHWIESKFV